MPEFFKDQALFDLFNNNYNIAQFLSFNSLGDIRFSINKKTSKICADNYQLIKNLIALSDDNFVNVRSYNPKSSQGCPFVYGVKNAEDVISIINARSNEGLYTIVNETIDINDGGVSGVSEGGVIEFAPKTTPRGVEELDVSSLPFELGKKIIETVYQTHLTIPEDKNERIEFSVHPENKGVLNTTSIVWERQATNREIVPNIKWPNPFSRFIGDKAFGLIVAYYFNMAVPFTIVFPRNKYLPPFVFGFGGTKKMWTRTCPAIQTPGKYTTVSKSVNPYQLMDEDDPNKNKIVSCLLQKGIEPLYSGAVITDSSGKMIIDGVKGYGDSFMQGHKVDVLPDKIKNIVANEWKYLVSVLGHNRFEWVNDGTKTWILQLHIGKTNSIGNIIYPGKPEKWIEFKPSLGLKELTKLINKIGLCGIKIIEPVGMTSHVADILRKNKIPSIIDYK